MRAVGTVCDARPVFDHVILRASDVAASARFYRTVLDTLGVAPTHSDESYAEWDDFGVRFAEDASHVTRRLHIGFVAPSRDHVEAFWEAGRSAGYADDGEPGPRTQYRYDYYGSFLLDPDGNSAEAVHHGDLSRDGNIDHLWIRSPDVRAATSNSVMIATGVMSAVHNTFARAVFSTEHWQQAGASQGNGGNAVVRANFEVTMVAEKFIYAIPVTGILMVLKSEAFDFSDTWVWLSIALYVIAVGNAHMNLIPGSKKMIELTQGPPGPEMEAVGKRLAIAGTINDLAAVAIIVLMVWKPGTF